MNVEVLVDVLVWDDHVDLQVVRHPVLTCSVYEDTQEPRDLFRLTPRRPCKYCTELKSHSLNHGIKFSSSLCEMKINHSKYSYHSSSSPAFSVTPHSILWSVGIEKLFHLDIAVDQLKDAAKPFMAWYNYLAAPTT